MLYSPKQRLLLAQSGRYVITLILKQGDPLQAPPFSCMTYLVHY